MCIGQHEDLSISEPTLEQSWAVAEKKSGSCFALPCWAGTRLATQDETKLEKAHELGYYLGMLIQVQDDLADLWPQQNKASDLHDRKGWSLPIAYAMTVLPPAAQQQLRHYLHQASEDTEAESAARELIVSSGAGLFLALKAKTCRLQAEAAVRQLTDDEVYGEKFGKLIEAVDFAA
jgi:geranylgeranyl pyrophosphate synthase